MVRKKMHILQPKKAPNTTLQKLYQEKKTHNIESKKDLTLLYKNYAEKKISQIRAKNST